jgi:hypothetical protein
MNEPLIHDFGIIDDKGDTFEFRWEENTGDSCRLEVILQTEKGPRRSTLAEISSDLWIALSDRVIRELIEGMGENERLKKAPTLKKGINRLSPLIGRELAVLLWSLMEAQDNGNTEAILHGWRELAREERWWLYAKAAAPGQRSGVGWRKALFHALSETSESRVSDPKPKKKKSPGTGSQCLRKSVGEKQNPTPPPPTTSRKRKPAPRTPTVSLQKNGARSPAEKKEKAARKTGTRN